MGPAAAAAAASNFFRFSMQLRAIQGHSIMQLRNGFQKWTPEVRYYLCLPASTDALVKSSAI